MSAPCLSEGLGLRLHHELTLEIFELTKNCSLLLLRYLGTDIDHLPPIKMK